MMTVVGERSKVRRTKLPKGSEPSWEVVALFPGQGQWSEEDYLTLGEKVDTHRLIELVNGRIEVLPVPTEKHQFIVLFLLDALRAFVKPHELGTVLFAGLSVRVRARNFRQPDVLFLSKKNEGKRGNRFWRGADLVMEVVSPDDPKRDYVAKRTEYAKAGIREYWIVDPKKRSITLLTLKGRAYTERGVFAPGENVDSIMLNGFSLAVAEVFAAGN